MITETANGLEYTPDTEIEVDWIRAMTLMDASIQGDKKAEAELQRMREAKVVPMSTGGSKK